MIAWFPIRCVKGSHCELESVDLQFVDCQYQRKMLQQLFRHKTQRHVLSIVGSRSAFFSIYGRPGWKRSEQSTWWWGITCRWNLQSLRFSGFTWLCPRCLWVLSPWAFHFDRGATTESQARCHQAQTHRDFLDPRRRWEASAIARRGCETSICSDLDPWQQPCQLQSLSCRDVCSLCRSYIYKS